jgi:hypothetical protein
MPGDHAEPWCPPVMGVVVEAIPVANRHEFHAIRKSSKKAVRTGWQRFLFAYYHIEIVI